MGEKPTRFFDLRPEDFPFHIDARNQAGEIVWSVDVPEPGVLDVPPLSCVHGPVSVTITYPGGTSETLANPFA